MVALSTYLGHSKVSHTYWYLEATPDLMRGIAKRCEVMLREDNMNPIASHITAFLQQFLPLNRGVSVNTCESYAYAFKLSLNTQVTVLRSVRRNYIWSNWMPR